MKLDDVLLEQTKKESIVINRGIHSYDNWVWTTSMYGDVIFDVNGEVRLNGMGANPNALKFRKIGKVDGDFYCDTMGLKSLDGAPEIVDGSFFCGDNKLKTLDHAPQRVSMQFDVSGNKLKNLKGAPNSVTSFNASSNQLTSLEGCPQIIVHNFNVSNNKSLVSLKGAPPHIGNNFDASETGITSLEHVPRKFVMGIFRGSRIKSLIGVHKYIDLCVGMDLSRAPITEGGLGLLLVNGLTKLIVSDFLDPYAKFAGPAEIIKKYLGKGKAGLLECQEELIDNGFEAYAKL